MEDNDRMRNASDVLVQLANRGVGSFKIEYSHKEYGDATLEVTLELTKHGEE